jgi:hypothetical protein
LFYLKSTPRRNWERIAIKVEDAPSAPPRIGARQPSAPDVVGARADLAPFPASAK